MLYVCRDCFRCAERPCLWGINGWPTERWGGVPQVQACVGGSAGPQCADQLPRHGHDDRQAAFYGQEMAGWPQLNISVFVNIDSAVSIIYLGLWSSVELGNSAESRFDWIWENFDLIWFAIVASLRVDAIYELWYYVEIISLIYWTCNHVWTDFKLISAAEIISKLFPRHWTCWNLEIIHELQ